jgi:transposase
MRASTVEARMALGKSRDPKKESFWRRMVRRQAGSVLSVRGWCEKHDLREATFYWWRAELGRRDAQEPTFVPVRVTEDGAPQHEGWIEIILAGGRQVRVSGRVDRAMLADVVAVLEERGC